MSQNNQHGKQWLWLLIAGLVLVAIATFAIHSHGWLKGFVLGIGGLLVVFASSEMMIHAVDGYAKRQKMNRRAINRGKPQSKKPNLKFVTRRP